MAKKISEKMDDLMDKKAGIKENSSRDKKLDAKRGLPPEVGFKRGGKVGKKKR